MEVKTEKRKLTVGRPWSLALVGLVFVFILVVVVAFQSEEKEPVYDGKKLSEWLSLYASSAQYSAPDDPDRLMTETIVRRVGTDGIPFYLKWIGYEPPAWRVLLLRASTKIPFLKNEKTGERILGNPPHPFIALYAFRILGAEGRTAIPDLTKKMIERNGARAEYPITVLSELGQDGLIALLEVATNRACPPIARLRATECIDQKIAKGNVTTSTSLAMVPALRTLLIDDTEVILRWYGTNILARIASRASDARTAEEIGKANSH